MSRAGSAFFPRLLRPGKPCAVCPGSQSESVVGETPAINYPIGHWGQEVTKYLLIGLAGFLGANLRYIVDGWVVERFGSTFPYGTLVVNVSGSFLIGLFMTLVAERFAAPPGTTLFFAIGLLGAYTTFSTFSYESIVLIQERAYMEAVTNLVANVLLGVAAAALGVIVGRIL